MTSTGLRHDNVKASIYWRETEDVEVGPPLQGSRRADLCIVGGGYTAMWAAVQLKQAQPDLDIVICEADYAGAGASGHNDGYVTPTIGHSLHSLIRRFGPDAAARAYAAVGRSITEIARFCSRNGIDAEIERAGFYLVASNAAQQRRLEHDRKLAQRLGSRSVPTIHYAADAREIIGSPAVHAAMPSGGALINPHKLARGLARVVAESGVSIYEQTTVRGVRPEGDGFLVTCDRGSVRTDQVLLATNAYQQQFQPFRRALLPVWSYALVTQPLTDSQLARVHWPNREGFVEGRNFILFGRLTADNRVLFGGGKAPYFLRGSMDLGHIRRQDVERQLRASFLRYFPFWDDVQIANSYGGCIAVTRDLVPHVGRQPSGVLHAYGYCGNGIAVTHTVGKVLRDLVLRRDTDYSRLLFVNNPKERKFPPEPLAWGGAKGLSSFLMLQDRYPDVLRVPFV